jgi:hypothetical protein
MKLLAIWLFLFMSSPTVRAIIDINLVEPPGMALEKEWTVDWRNLSFGFDQWYTYRPMSGMIEPDASVPRYTTLYFGPVVVFAPGSVRVVAPVAVFVVVSALLLFVMGWRKFRKRRKHANAA